MGTVGGGLSEKVGGERKSMRKKWRREKMVREREGGEIDGTMVTPGTGWQSVCEVIEVRGKF